MYVEQPVCIKSFHHFSSLLSAAEAEAIASPLQDQGFSPKLFELCTSLFSSSMLDYMGWIFLVLVVVSMCISISDCITTLHCTILRQGSERDGRSVIT